MGLYARYVWAPLLDWFMRQPPIMEHRRTVVPLARGRVLEIGIGSGLNLRCYDGSRVERIWGLEPSGELRRVAGERAASTGLPVELVAGSAERIPMEDGFFDTVVTTWTMCSIPDLTRALREMRRVLRPGGQLLFAEHGLSPDSGVAVWQGRLNPVWRTLSSGCNLNRDIARFIRDGGFKIERLTTGYLEGPKLLTYNCWGAAAPP